MRLQVQDRRSKHNRRQKTGRQVTKCHVDTETSSQFVLFVSNLSIFNDREALNFTDGLDQIFSFLRAVDVGFFVASWSDSYSLD